MTLRELKAALDEAVSLGYGDLYVVYRDENTDPDLDAAGAYVDTEANRFVIHGYLF